MSTLTPGTWARVRLHPDCPGGGRRPHRPAEDGCRVEVMTVDNGGDHSAFALHKGRVDSYVGPRPDRGLYIGRSFRPDGWSRSRSRRSDHWHGDDRGSRKCGRTDSPMLPGRRHDAGSVRGGLSDR